MVSTEDIKKLRQETGVSVALCKNALEEAGGDHDKALLILATVGAKNAGKKADRTLGAGTVVAYIHTNKNLGAMVSLLCETDFVSKNEDFTALAYDIAMHISAMSPSNILDLLEQPFIKDPSKTIRQLIDSAVQKFGERVELSRFERLTTME